MVPIVQLPHTHCPTSAFFFHLCTDCLSRASRLSSLGFIIAKSCVSATFYLCQDAMSQPFLCPINCLLCTLLPCLRRTHLLNSGDLKFHCQTSERKLQLVGVSFKINAAGPTTWRRNSFIFHASLLWGKKGQSVTQSREIRLHNKQRQRELGNHCVYFFNNGTKLFQLQFTHKVRNKKI